MPAASSRSPHLTKATKAFVDAITAENNPPLYTLPPQAARRILADAQAKPIKKLAMDMHDEDLPVGPTGKVPTRFIRPEGAGGKLPIVFYFHGGGWILGDKDTHDRLVRELAKGAKAAVVYPNYTPSPEAQYPVPLEQAYAAMLYIIEHADAYGLDPSRIAVAGDSVGGNMATGMTRQRAERAGDCVPASAVPGDGCQLRYGIVPYLRRGPLADPRSHEMVLGCLCPGRAPPRRDHRLPVEGHAGTARRASPGHDHHGGKRRAAR